MNYLFLYSSDTIDDAASCVLGWIVFGIVASIALNLLLCHYAGRNAQRKGYSYWGYWWLNFFFGIIGIIISACIPDLNRNIDSSNKFWVCSECNKKVDLAYEHCPNCGTKKEKWWVCDKCGVQNMPHANFCGSCGRQRIPEEERGWACSQCSTLNKPEAKFCSNCGKPRQ